MHALILNGALSGDAGITPIQASLATALSARGWSADQIELRKVTVSYCQGCFECWVKTPGICKINDEARAITRAFWRSDLAVFLSPVTFGGYSSELKKAIDRMLGGVLPFFQRRHGEVHHTARYAHRPALLAVGVMDAPDAEEEGVFRALVARNAINFDAPAHLAGIVYRGDPAEEMWRTVGQLVSGITAENRGAA